MKNKNLKRFFAGILSVVCIAVVCVGCGNKNRNPSKFNSDAALYTAGMSYKTTTKGTPVEYAAMTFDFLGGDTVMPIGGFYGPYAAGGSLNGNLKEDLLSDRVFQDLKDAGINLFVYNKDVWKGENGGNNVEKCLDLCEKYGIGYFVMLEYLDSQFGTKLNQKPASSSDLNTEEGVAKLQRILDNLTKNGTRKSVVGIHVRDEPFMTELTVIQLFKDVFYNKLENNYDLKLFGNSLGRWTGEWNLFGTTQALTADEYYEIYMDIAKPSIFSATCYPFKEKDMAEEELTKRLYDNLAKFRELAMDNDLPFWRMMQAGGQWNDASAWVASVEPYQSESELLLDVNMALAYGAKAIQYFTLVQPEHYSYCEGYTYDYERCGLVGADGHLTRWYYYAQRANKQVQAVDEFLMKSASTGVIVHGANATKTIITDSDREADKTYISGEKYKEMIGLEGDDCVVGCFDYQGGTALYVVNPNRYAKSDTLVKFDDTYRYTVIQRADTADIVGTSIPLTLDAGEGALIVLH